MGHVRGYKVVRGWSNSKINMLANGSRARTSNNEQLVSPEDPNFLGKRCGRLELGCLENTVQEAIILLRISFR